LLAIRIVKSKFRIP